MHILVFGSGCSVCQESIAMIEQIIAGGEITLEVSEDWGRMFGYGIQSTPAIVIDGCVVSVSEHLSEAQLRALIEHHSNT